MKHTKKILLVMGILMISFLTVSSTYAANSWGLDDIQYTDRAGWGADETMTYSSRPEYQKFLANQEQEDDDNPTVEETKTAATMNYLNTFFPQEVQTDRIQTLEGSNTLFWPLQYVTQKTKLVIHHTATNGTLPSTIEEEKAFMKNLYKYHAFTNGWGDIGYHFVVMPSGRIYEGRKGGAGVIGAHVALNNTKTVGISLVGNFENIKPTTGQLRSLLNVLTSLSRKYAINPLYQATYFKKSSTFPYVIAVSEPSIIGHRDAGYTACPGANLYSLLPAIRVQVARTLGVLGAATTPNTNTTPNTTPNNSTPTGTSNTSSTLQTIRQTYATTHSVALSSSNIKRLDGAPSYANINAIKNMLVRVLLYEASLKDSWIVTCDTGCIVRVNGLLKRANKVVVGKSNTAFRVAVGGRIYTSNRFAISVADEQAMSITSFDRKASNGQPLNMFRQSLLFTYGAMKKVDGTTENRHQVINIVSLDNYMKGIAEASDTEPQTKTNVLALLSKTYAMYYMGGQIKHPSIPADALYNAIDDPRMFQKYLGYGWEKISKSRPTALNNTKNMTLVYDNKIPILPYFHCSAGFTWAGKEKRGWQDTPYLQSVLDTNGACDSKDFEGHGVGLSGKGATAMAKNGSTEAEIIKYYYPGVEIKTTY